MGKWYFKYLFHYVLVFVVIFPLCLIKDVSKLRIFSLFGILSLVFIIILIIVECHSFIKYYYDNVYISDDETTHLNVYDASRGFKGYMPIFQFSSSLFYAYVTTIGALPIFNSLKNKHRRRIYKVVRRTLLFDIVVFLVIATVGYLTWPIGTPSLIIERPKIVSGPDILMCIARFALIITVIFKLPSLYNSLRISIFGSIWGTTEITTGKNIIVTMLVFLFCCTVSILYTEISGYINFIGGLCSSIVGFFFPALLYLKKKDHITVKAIIVLIIFSIVTIIGLIAAGTTIAQIISGKK